MRGVDMLDYLAIIATGRATAPPLRTTVLDALQLSQHDLQRPVRDYSKGMRQKLAVAQALQHDPDLMVMDEPSEGLDPLVQHALYDLLRDRAVAGTTIVFSSHTLSEVEALCDRVAIIRKGRTVVQATLEELQHARPRIVRLRSSDPDIDTVLGPEFRREPDEHNGRRVYQTSADPNAIAHAVGKLNLIDLLIEEPSLEEIFRSYYVSDEENHR
jgi:ABC-2 type transport system ATP-binding protein